MAHQLRRAEPSSFDYDDTVVNPGEQSFGKKSAGFPLYAPVPFRGSNHDPVLVALTESGPGAAIGAGLLGLALAIARRSRARIPIVCDASPID